MLLPEESSNLSQHDEKSVLGTAVVAVGEKTGPEDQVAYEMLPPDAIDPKELESHQSSSDSNSQQTGNDNQPDSSTQFPRPFQKLLATQRFMHQP